MRRADPGNGRKVRGHPVAEVAQPLRPCPLGQPFAHARPPLPDEGEEHEGPENLCIDRERTQARSQSRLETGQNDAYGECHHQEWQLWITELPAPAAHQRSQPAPNARNTAKVKALM